jgi:hypothetical protein
MNPPVNKKVTLGCLTCMVVAMVVVTYLASSSVNPLAVYSSESIVAKVIVSVLLLLVLTSLLQSLTVAMNRWMIRSTTGKPADDVICPGCGLPLLPYQGSHGVVIICPKCRLPWHNGPACYSKGLQQRVIIPTVLCPRCREGVFESHLHDLQSDLDDVVK